MDLMQILGDILETQGLAVFLVVVVTLVMVWLLRWMMNTVYPAYEIRANRTLDIRLAEAHALDNMADAQKTLVSTVEDLHGTFFERFGRPDPAQSEGSSPGT